jgi:hypothetical protein
VITQHTSIRQDMALTTAIAAVVLVATSGITLGAMELFKRWEAVLEVRGWPRRYDVAFNWGLTILIIWAIVMTLLAIRGIIWWGLQL